MFVFSFGFLHFWLTMW